MASKPFFDNAKKEWCCKYRPDPKGGWVKVKLCDRVGPPGREPKKPPQAAIERQREFAEIEYRVKHGLQAPQPKARDLAAYLDAYVESRRVSNRESSVVLLRRYIRNFLAFAADRKITSIQAVTRADCRDYLEMRLKTVKPSSLKSERGMLMGAWTRAVEDELIPMNPWSIARNPGKIVEAVPTFWSEAEVASIAKHCFRPWQSDLVLILANTGMRISTALAMAWGWVDWKANLIAIPGGIAGVKTSYKFTFNDTARDVLQKRSVVVKDSPLVFPHPEHGGKISYHTARLAIERAIRDAGVKHGTAHDLRHTHGRWLALEGVPASVIQNQLGHTTLAMTMKYMTTDAEHSARFILGTGMDPDADLPRPPKPGPGGPGPGVEE